MFNFKNELAKISLQKVDSKFLDCKKDVNATF